MTEPAHAPEERGEPRCVVTASCYRRSRAALGDTPQTERVAAALESLAASRPYAVPPFPGTIVRVLRARPYGDFPALRLYYSVDDAAIRFLWIEHYDEMEP
jgi:hypothetical protein